MSTPTDWRALARAAHPETGFAEPAAAEALLEIEHALGQPLPEELAALLRQSDGLCGPYGEDVVWNARQIAADNLDLRQNPEFPRLYMPFEPLMFFGDSGGGDLFAFVRTPSRPEVFVWDHETDSRTWVAAGLRPYLTRSLRADGTDWYRPEATR
jgi:hypothetical protein